MNVERQPHDVTRANCQCHDPLLIEFRNKINCYSHVNYSTAPRGVAIWVAWRVRMLAARDRLQAVTRGCPTIAPGKRGPYGPRSLRFWRSGSAASHQGVPFMNRYIAMALQGMGLYLSILIILILSLM